MAFIELGRLVNRKYNKVDDFCLKNGRRRNMSSIDHKKLIQQYYRIRAKDYDKQKSRTWKSTSGFGNEVTGELFGALAGFSHKLVLEVGVGSGRNALPVLEEIKPSFVGLDMSKEMLKLAKAKMSSFKQNFDLVLGDAEHLPFVKKAFNAIICMSTMHYFEFQERILGEFSEMLKEKGAFVYGDLTAHELDNQGFLERLERTVSKVHARYYKPSEMKRLLETHGLRCAKMKTVSYRKSCYALIEDKGEYFDVTPEMLYACMQGASIGAKGQYSLTGNEMTLFYTVIAALKTGS